jgi:hypothetical protein
MPLEALSNELLDEIIRLSLLTDRRSPNISAKYHLALCSKRLNALTSPYLYHDFIQGTWKQDQAFLRTILRRPELGRHVRSLTFSIDLIPSKYSKRGSRDLILETEDL